MTVPAFLSNFPVIGGIEGNVLVGYIPGSGSATLPASWWHWSGRLVTLPNYTVNSFPYPDMLACGLSPLALQFGGFWNRNSGSPFSTARTTIQLQLGAALSNVILQVTTIGNVIGPDVNGYQASCVSAMVTFIDVEDSVDGKPAFTTELTGLWSFNDFSGQDAGKVLIDDSEDD